MHANWNVTSAVNYAAVPLDRVYTTPYGQPTFDTETINGDYDADGDIDSSDDSSFTTCNAAADPPTGSCRTFDFDNDADIDTADETIFDTLYPGSTEITRQPSRRTSANGLPFAHQGLRFDEETSTYQNRNRQYNPQIHRFTERDPLGTPATHCGLLYDYEAELSNPPSHLDPSGLFPHVHISQPPWAPAVTVTLNVVMWGIDACSEQRNNVLAQIDRAWNIRPFRQLEQCPPPCPGGVRRHLLSRCARTIFKINLFRNPNTDHECYDHVYVYHGGGQPDCATVDENEISDHMGTTRCTNWALQSGAEISIFLGRIRPAGCNTADIGGTRMGLSEDGYANATGRPTAAHELGHIMGLCHPGDTEDVPLGACGYPRDCAEGVAGLMGHLTQYSSASPCEIKNVFELNGYEDTTSCRTVFGDRRQRY